MKKNTVKEKLAAGKPAVGTWISLASWISAEYMAHVGFDWLVVDTEHSPVGFETTVNCFQAICTTDTIPMARVTWNDPTLIKRLLDAGAIGVGACGRSLCHQRRRGSGQSAHRLQQSDQRQRRVRLVWEGARRHADRSRPSSRAQLRRAQRRWQCVSRHLPRCEHGQPRWCVGAC